MKSWNEQNKEFMALADAYRKEKAALKQAVEQAKAEREHYAALIQAALDQDAIDETTAVYQLKLQRAEQVIQQREQALEELQAKPLLTDDQVNAYWASIRSFYSKRCDEKKQAADKHLREAMDELDAVGDIQQEAAQAGNEFRGVCSACGVDMRQYQGWQLSNSIGSSASNYRKQLDEVRFRFARS